MTELGDYVSEKITDEQIAKFGMTREQFEEELNEWDGTHDEKFVSRMVCPPADEVGGNTGYYH